jgi:glycosyltransferase involved in cell wall biosynthesis
MRIVFVGNFALWHKATLSARTLPMARELAAAGHRPLVVVPPWDAPDERPPAGGRVWDVPVRYVPVRGGPLGHTANARAVLGATLAARPDVVVAVKPKAYAGLVALALAPLRRSVRVVVDSDDWEGRGGWNELTPGPALLKEAIAWHEVACLRAADQVVVASRGLETLALSSGVWPGRVTYLPNATWEGAAGWPAGDRARARRELELGDAPTLLLYSRLFELDLARFVRVARRALEAVSGARLLVVGAGLFGEDARLRRALDAAGILARSRLLGWVERERLPDLLAAGDVALVPLDDTLVNRCRCSVKLLDLMLSGRAIVAERVGQAGEYLRDGQSGRLVSPADEAALAEAAVALLRDRAEAGRLGEAAERDARERFSWAAQRAALVTAVTGHG